MDQQPISMIDQLVEKYPDQEFLYANGLDSAIIGVDEVSWRLIYSVSEVINIFLSEGMTMEDAYDHFAFNVYGSYVGEKTPIWCFDDF